MIALPITTFCWLPPESDCASSAGAAGRIDMVADRAG